MSQDYRKLIVWRKAHAVVLDLHSITAHFPVDERYGLTLHARKTSRSIPTNIAEGSRRIGRRDYSRFLTYALGSTGELDYQLLLSRDLGYIDESTWKELEERVAEVGRMLHAMIRSLRATPGCASSPPRT